MSTLPRHQQPDPLLVRFAIASALLHLAAWLGFGTVRTRPAPPPAMLIELAAPRPSGPQQDAAAPRAQEPAGGRPALKPETPPKPPPAKPAARQPAPDRTPAKPPVKKTPPPAKRQATPEPAPHRAASKPAPTQQPASEQPAAPTDRGAEDNASPAADPGRTLDDIRRLLRQKGGNSGTAVAGHALPEGIQGRLYFNQLVAAIRAAWTVPPGVGHEPVEVDVMIDGRGRVVESGLRRSSGSPLLDRSALQAIRNASIPPPPADFRTPLKLTFRLIPPEG